MWLLVGVLFLLWYMFVYKTRIQRMAGLIPGPRPFPIIGTMYCGFQKDKFLSTFQRLVKDYGSTFGLWFGPYYCVAISDPKDMEVIYKNNYEIHKSFIYKKLLPWLGNGLVLNSSLEKWRMHRKAITPTFHFKILETFMPVFNQNSVLLTSVLKKKSSNIDMFKLMSQLTLDILCETSLGVQLDNLKYEKSKFFEAMFKLGDLNTQRAFNIFYMIDWIFYMSAKGREVQKLTHYTHGIVDSIIKQRQAILDKKIAENNTEADNDKGNDKLQTFLDLLLESRKAGSVLFTDIEIRDEVNTFLFAGHETTAVTLSFFCYSISQHPEIQERLYAEQKSIFGDSKLEEVTISHLSEMKYLEKVIKETLRMYTPSVFTMRTLQNDLQLNSGYTVPAGSNIMILPYAAHLNPKIFPEPLVFNPDRFNTPDAITPFSYVPFSAGPRNCIGQKYSMMKMKVILSHVIRNFRIIASNIPLKLVFQISLKSETGCYVRVEPRT